MSTAMPTVGVLALQGDFSLHAELLTGLGVDVRLVRRASELDGCDALVLPGGESTTLTKLLDRLEMRAALGDFVHRRPVLGTCAGCILLATELEDAGGVVPLGRLDLRVRRNGFGRQIDSFEAPILMESGPEASATMAPASAFIRAPRILAVGDGVEILGRWQGEVVAVGEGSAMALTFHPEVVGDPTWHRIWMARGGLLPAEEAADGSA